MPNSTVFVLLGNFGVGKTSICNKEMVEFSKIEWAYLGYKNLYNLGGFAGYDALSKYRLEHVVRAMDIGKNYLVHGVYFSSGANMQRLLDKGFKVHVIVLNTSRQANMDRIASRGGKWVESTYESYKKRQDKIVAGKLGQNIKVTIIDNDRWLDDVKKDVWEIIASEI